MLDPNTFTANDTWVFFQLSSAPICTVQDGDFNIFALLDAASGFMLATTFVSVNATEMPLREVKKLLNDARAHKEELPTTILIPDFLEMTGFIAEAQRRAVTIERVPLAQLGLLIGDALKGFAEEFGGGGGAQ